MLGHVHYPAGGMQESSVHLPPCERGSSTNDDAAAIEVIKLLEFMMGMWSRHKDSIRRLMSSSTSLLLEKQVDGNGVKDYHDNNGHSSGDNHANYHHVIIKMEEELRELRELWPSLSTATTTSQMPSSDNRRCEREVSKRKQARGENNLMSTISLVLYSFFISTYVSGACGW